jgi:hypothetical protein
MNNTQTKRRGDDTDDMEDDVMDVDTDTIVDPTARQQYDPDDDTLPGEEVGETETGMEDVDNPNRRKNMSQGAADEGSIVPDEDLEEDDLDEEGMDEDISDVPM